MCQGAWKSINDPSLIASHVCAANHGQYNQAENTDQLLDGNLAEIPLPTGNKNIVIQSVFSYCVTNFFSSQRNHPWEIHLSSPSWRHLGHYKVAVHLPSTEKWWVFPNLLAFPLKDGRKSLILCLNRSLGIQRYTISESSCYWSQILIYQIDWSCPSH